MDTAPSVMLVPVVALAQNSRLWPGAVLVHIVRSIAVVWGVVISARTDARFVAWVLKDAPSITINKDKRKKTRLERNSK